MRIYKIITQRLNSKRLSNRTKFYLISFLTFIPILLIFVLLKDGKKNDCENYYPIEEGTSFTLQSFSSKGKLTAFSKYKILNVEKSNGNTIAFYFNELYDEKENLVTTNEIEMRCEEGSFYVDMKSRINHQQMEAYANMKVKIDGDFLEWPSQLRPGQLLKNASLKMEVMNEGVKLTTIEMFIKNRKVENREYVTTPAGIFDCYKISYDMESVTTAFITMRFNSKGVDWISPGNGVIRSESYNEKGKLQEYTILSQMNKGSI